MTLAIRQVVCALVVSALAVPVSLAHAAADGGGTRPTAVPGIRASIAQAVQAATVPVPSRAVAAPGFTTPAFPVTPKRDRSLKQMSGGGGGGMMVMGIIGSLAGLAGTYYMVKMMKDQQNQANTTAQ